MPSIPGRRLAGSAHAPGRVVRWPAVIGALIVFPIFGVMSFDDPLGAFVNHAFQSLTIRRRAVRAKLPIHFGGRSHSNTRVANLVLQQVCEVTRPLCLHLGQDIAGREPPWHGGDDGRCCTQAGAGTPGRCRRHLIAPLHSPLSIAVKAIVPRTRPGNGLPNLAEVGAGDGIEVGRPMNGLRADRNCQRHECNRPETCLQRPKTHRESLDRKFWCA